jgi:hypothetical protein
MGYWIVSVVVVLVGFVTGFSIGTFILPIGIALLVLGPVRHRPRLFWPVLLGVVGYEIAFLLYAPLICTSTATIPDGVAETVCTTILGPDYRGSGTYNPSLEPARIVGLIGGVVAAAVTFVIVRAFVIVRRLPPGGTV